MSNPTPPVCVIYGLRAVGTERVMYVGQTSRGMPFRLGAHYHRFRTSDRPLYSWWQELGRDGVEAVILESFGSPDELNDAEVRWIATLKTHVSEGGFNETRGGDVYHRGYKHSAEAREKISSANRGLTRGAEARERVADAHRGRKHSDESRANMSAGQRGRKHTAETRAKISASNRGRKTPYGSEEAQRKFSGAGSHTRWHTNRGIVKPECGFCQAA